MIGVHKRKATCLVAGNQQPLTSDQQQQQQEIRAQAKSCARKRTKLAASETSPCNIAANGGNKLAQHQQVFHSQAAGNQQGGVICATQKSNGGANNGEDSVWIFGLINNIEQLLSTFNAAAGTGTMDSNRSSNCSTPAQHQAIVHHSGANQATRSPPFASASVCSSQASSPSSISSCSSSAMPSPASVIVAPTTSPLSSSSSSSCSSALSSSSSSSSPAQSSAASSSSGQYNTKLFAPSADQQQQQQSTVAAAKGSAVSAAVAAAASAVGNHIPRSPISRQIKFHEYKGPPAAKRQLQQQQQAAASQASAGSNNNNASNLANKHNNHQTSSGHQAKPHQQQQQQVQLQKQAASKQAAPSGRAASQPATTLGANCRAQTQQIATTMSQQRQPISVVARQPLSSTPQLVVQQQRQVHLVNQPVAFNCLSNNPTVVSSNGFGQQQTRLILASQQVDAMPADNNNQAPQQLMVASANQQQRGQQYVNNITFAESCLDDLVVQQRPQQQQQQQQADSSWRQNQGIQVMNHAPQSDNIEQRLTTGQQQAGMEWTNDCNFTDGQMRRQAASLTSQQFIIGRQESEQQLFRTDSELLMAPIEQLQQSATIGTDNSCEIDPSLDGIEELLFSEFIDLQDVPLNVDESDWLRKFLPPCSMS